MNDDRNAVADKHDALQKILEGPPLSATAFPPNSRYHGLGTLKLAGCRLPVASCLGTGNSATDNRQLATEDGVDIIYLKRRVIPTPDSLSEVGIHVVHEGERLDNIAAQYLGDPELFWRLCDANGAMRPEELTETLAKELRITLPAGIGGGRT